MYHLTSAAGSNPIFMPMKFLERREMSYFFSYQCIPPLCNSRILIVQRVMLGSSISPISDEIICPMQQEYAKLKLKKDPWYGITIKKIKKKS